MRMALIGGVVAILSQLAFASPKEDIRIEIELLSQPKSPSKLVSVLTAKPYHRFCAPVLVDVPLLQDTIRRLAEDNSLFESTALWLSLPAVGPIEYSSVDAQSHTDWPNREHLHWVGEDRESLIASIRISPYGRVRGTFFTAKGQYELHTDRRSADYVLCERDPQWTHKID